MLCHTEPFIQSCLQEVRADASERRTLRRKPFFRRAAMTNPGDPPRSFPAFCRDISRNGIGLLHEMPLENGSTFALSIPLMGLKLELQCETKWCTAVGDGEYFSGAVFRCDSTPQSFFLLSAVVGEELNRRWAKRSPLFRAVILEDAQGNPKRAFSRDISRGGIGLLHRHRIPLGTVVIRIPSLQGSDIVTCVDIRRCELAGDPWYLSGGEFPIPWQKEAGALFGRDHWNDGSV